MPLDLEHFLFVFVFIYLFCDSVQMSQLNTRTLLELRVLIKIDRPPNAKTDLAPDKIIVKVQEIARKLTTPRWTKLDGNQGAESLLCAV